VIHAEPGVTLSHAKLEMVGMSQQLPPR